MKKNEKKYIFVVAHLRLILCNSVVMYAKMNKIRQFWLIGLALILAPQISLAQDGALLFDAEKYDFGEIAEDGGNVEHIFRFENVSSTPVVILSVYATCGCTTSEYSRKPIKAGQKGEIKVSFDPMHRPGRFSKSITITTSAGGGSQKLSIEGFVRPRVKSIEEQYPFDMGGGVRFATNFHAFAYVGRGESVEESVAWINTSARDVSLRFIPQQSSGQLLVESPSILPAAERGVIRVIYRVSADSDCYGTLNDTFCIEVDGRLSRTLFSTNAVAVDKFDRANDDISSPIALFTKKIIKFAEINHSTAAVDDSWEIVNDGGGDLIIRAIEFDDAVLDCSLKAGERIKVGQRLRVRLTLDASACDYGAVVERIRVITNDPRQPMQSVRVTAIVVE